MPGTAAPGTLAGRAAARAPVAASETCGDPPGRRAVFIDRDGVINQERGHVHRPQDFRLLPGALRGMRLLQAQGWRLVVVTNQAGIGRGLYTEADYAQLTAHLQTKLRRAGVTLDGVYHCPHHPVHGLGPHRIACTCRKPGPGMLQRAAAELGLALHRSVIVGDKRSDLDAGRAAGVARCLLVTCGHAVQTADRAAADLVCSDLLEAARALLAEPGGSTC